MTEVVETIENTIPDPHYPVRRYNKMETCEHKNFTLIYNDGKIFFKCKHKCLMAWGENDMEKVLQILNSIPKAKVSEFQL